MTSRPTVTSLQNPQVRDVRRLRDARQRRKSGLILIDGFKEIGAAASAGFDIQVVYVAVESTTDRASLPDGFEQGLPAKCLVQPVSESVMARLSYGQQGGIPVAVASPPSVELGQLHLNAASRILVLDRTEKPGNLGACLRTAAACGLDAVVLTDPICELFNPNAIRASRGAIFRLPLAVTSPAELIKACQKAELVVHAARVDTPHSLWDCELAGGFAIVFGNEADGLGDQWIPPNVRPFTIPMHASTDSLNLSISCAVTLYESNRQRKDA